MYWVTLLIILIHVGSCHRNIHCICTSSGWYVSWDNRFACTCSVDLFILQNHVMSVWPHLIWWDDFKNFQCKGNGRHIHRIVWNERRDSVRACMLCQEQVSRAGTSKYTHRDCGVQLLAPTLVPTSLLAKHYSIPTYITWVQIADTLISNSDYIVKVNVLWISSLNWMSEDTTSIRIWRMTITNIIFL